MNLNLISMIFAGCILILSCTNSSKPETNQKIQKKNEPGVAKKQEPFVSFKKADLSNMILFPAGKYLIGSEKGLPNELPVHEIELSAFYIDKSPVTVKEFSEFVGATGFKTEAEQFGDAGAFNFETKQWELKKGANWKFPFGADGEKAKDNHPVTQISWNDAVAYAVWAGKRLPTEAEWEVAAKSGQHFGQRYSWGDELLQDGKYKANVWQGSDVSQNTNEDGYRFTSPVGVFGENAAGLTDMGGNVWNWCQDTYQLYPGNQTPFRKDENVKVIRGGSFFFDHNGEHSFTTSGRSFNSHETSLFNTGFRCAADAENM